MRILTAILTSLLVAGVAFGQVSINAKDVTVDTNGDGTPDTPLQSLFPFGGALDQLSDIQITCGPEQGFLDAAGNATWTCEDLQRLIINMSAFDGITEGIDGECVVKDTPSGFRFEPCQIVGGEDFSLRPTAISYLNWTGDCRDANGSNHWDDATLGTPTFNTATPDPPGSIAADNTVSFGATDSCRTAANPTWLANTTHTMGGWMKLPTFTSGGRWWDFQTSSSGIELKEWTDATQFNAIYGDGTTQNGRSTPFTSATDWHHVVIRYSESTGADYLNAGDMEWFVDGVLACQGGTCQNKPVLTYPTIRAEIGGGNATTASVVDFGPFLMFNELLTAQEICEAATWGWEGHGTDSGVGC